MVTPPPVTVLNYRDIRKFPIEVSISGTKLSVVQNGNRSYIEQLRPYRGWGWDAGKGLVYRYIYREIERGRY
jgi:hypothetical protein